MAATIDHLRVDHVVRVLQDFTDTRGHTHSAGTSATIRAMGLDTTRMELWIEWELRGTRERLHFALSATTGPGNGRMREYFELGEPDDANGPSAKVTPAVVQSTTPFRGVTTEPRAAAVPVRHPPAGTSLGDVAVACQCDAAMHRSVLVHGAGVHACMRCGTITCTHVVGDDGHHTGTVWLAHIVDDVSDQLLEWLARWPRIVYRRRDLHRWPIPAGLTRDEIVYLPADVRCDTAAELIALENQRAAGPDHVAFPTQRPPVKLPTRLDAFAQFADAVQLTPESDLATLIAAAEPRNAASRLAVSHVLRRADAFDVIVTALRSDDTVWQSAGAAMARAAQPVDPRLPDVLIDILGSLTVSPSSRVPDRVVGADRFEELLLVIADQKLDTPAILAALPLLQRRVARLDTTLASRIGLVLRELHGTPPPRTRPGFLP